MATTIASVATIPLLNAHILQASWCPDKDLLVVISRVANQDKVALYKMQGSKKWEVSLQPPDEVAKVATEVVGVAWSPDVQSVAVISNPATLTVHSVQDGRPSLTIPIGRDGRRVELKGVWWFREEKKVVENDLPDIFKKGENLAGSAHAILQGLPQLDPIQDDTKPLTSSELFAFQGARNRAAPKATIPDSIRTWPTLPPDPFSSSIGANKPDVQSSFPEAVDEPDNTNVNSILVVADNLGDVHLFLEGSYPLGAVSLQSRSFPRSLYNLREHLFAHAGLSAPAADGTVGLLPRVVRLPYLTGRHFRDVARVSSSARELMAYVMRVVKDMRAAWFGNESQGGARDLGRKWIQSLESRQADAFGEPEPYALLDLTCLLTTGRSSEGLMDYLGSGEHMSERSMYKWDTTMCEALIRLRDLSEKRVAPACQRLHLLLQEVEGWAALPQYAVCGFKPSEVEECLGYTASAIFQASWLAATARRELLRFKEFMKWIRYETGRANSTADHHNQRPQHDILEVNEYLTSSLVVSPIDKWFVGPVARISREAIGVPSEKASITSAIAKARAALDRWDQTVREDVRPRDLSHVERNLDTLLQTLAGRCQQMFSNAALAATRSAELMAGRDVAAPTEAPEAAQSAGGPSSSAPLIRERTVVADETKASEPDNFLQFLAIRPPHDGGRSYLCIARLQQGLGALASVPAVEVSVLECCAGPEEGSEERTALNLLDVEFFDSEKLVIVYRPKDQERAVIATVGYKDLIYHPIPAHGYVNGTTRERLMGDVLERLTNGQLPSAPVAIIQSRTLGGCTEGSVSLAVNGRAGRRVACVLDAGGETLEVLDMEGEDDDDDEEDEEELEADEGDA